MAKRLLHAGEVGDSLVEKVFKGGYSEIVLCSDGGDIYAARAISDYLLKNEKQVTAVGACMSAATAILVCGGPALCYPSTRFMVHRSSTSGSGGAREMANNAEELKLWDEWYFDLLERWTKTGRDEWKELCAEESVFGAKVALDLGLVDGIL